MKKFFLLLLLITTVTSLSLAQDGLDIWTLTTSGVGRVYAMVIDPSNQDIMYAGGLDLGIYKTTDGGVSWLPVNNGLLLTSIQALAISQNNPQYLYAGTGSGSNGGVYRTTNGGTSWTLINTGITESSISIQALMVHPNDPDIAWCAVFDGLSDAVNGLYKTTNGGSSWIPSTNGIGTLRNFLSFAMSPTDPNTIYAGTSFVVASSSGPSMIYKSTDGGDNWFNSSNGLPSDPTEINPVRTLNISSGNPNFIVAGLFLNTVNGGVYISTDAGANWTKKFNGAPSDVGTLIRSGAIRPGSDSQIYIGLDRSTSLNIGVWATTDGGNNWFSFNGGEMLSTYTIRALVFNSTGNHTLFAGSASPIGSGAGVYEYTYSVIPVEMVSFSADVTSSSVALSWITATETNNQGFEVERQIVGASQWMNVGYVPGNGSTTEIHQYSFTDNLVPTGKYMYRLKQIDYNGSYTYSKIIEAEILPVSDFALFQNYPNPFNPGTKITYSIPYLSFVTLKVFNVLGNEVATLVNGEKPDGTYEIEFDGNNLPSGIYFYHLKAGSFIDTKKMILLK